MARLACVDLPALPLQLLLKQQPAWQELPVAVVDHDKPNGRILWINERARRQRVLRGMRYAQGLALAPTLRAGVVTSDEIERCIAQLVDALRTFSPDVEPCSDEPGIFWVNAAGLGGIYPSLPRWAEGIEHHLKTLGLVSSVVVGFTRFGSYAVARGCRETLVFPSAENERTVAREVPLARLVIEPKVRDTLRKLGVVTVRDLLALPAEGVLKRFGTMAHRIHQLGSGRIQEPFQPAGWERPAECRVVLEFAVFQTSRILFLIKSHLPRLLAVLAERGQGLVSLTVLLKLDDGGTCTEEVRPATPVLDERVILDLVRLMLERVAPRSGVNELCMTAQGGRTTTEQLRLFSDKPRRDLAAANRALARLRAELGTQAVVRAELRNGHLPEASFSWVPLDVLVAPQSRQVQVRPLVRRFYERRFRLESKPRSGHNDGWLVGGLSLGPVTAMWGPYVLSGGWWGGEIHRRYHFIETRRGDLLWAYYDRRKRCWVCQGRVE